MSGQSPIHSMTGFASLETELPDKRGCGLTIKAVNHRHLDLSLRLPGGLDALEPGLRKAVKAQVRRGHVELTLTLERAGIAGRVRIDEPLLLAYAAAFQQASKLVGVHQTVDLNGLLRMSGVMSAAAVVEDLEALEAQVLAAVEGLLARFEAARVAEGTKLADELRASLERIDTLAAEARELRAGVAATELERLKTRMAELLAGAPVSEERLLTEAALLAGRGDVEEELVRLRTHVGRFGDLLDGGGEVGRELEFLLQEMNREANTALSKTGASAGAAGLRLTEIGLAVKVELERAREQVQNLE